MPYRPLTFSPKTTWPVYICTSLEAHQRMREENRNNANVEGAWHRTDISFSLYRPKQIELHYLDQSQNRETLKKHNKALKTWGRGMSSTTQHERQIKEIHCTK